MYHLSFSQQSYPNQYDNVKTLEPVTDHPASKRLPSKIDITIHGFGSLFPLQVKIDKRASQNLPFVLSIEVKNAGLNQKTSQVFYFTINNKYENTFNYLGTLPNKDKNKTDFLITFFKACKGCKESQVQLADMYFEGQNVPVNRREALRYYAHAAFQGDLRAQTMVALHISEGLFIKQDHEIAFDVLKYLADNFKYPEAQYQLGKYLEQGLGCERNIPESLRYCMLAAEKNHKMALFALVIHYTDKSYNNINYKKATDLLTILIHLHFGKEISKEKTIHWINQLGGSELPDFFWEKVICLYQQTLKG